MLRFDGIRQSEEDRTLSAIIPEFSEITADLIADNLLVLHMYNVLVFVYFHLFLPRGLCCRKMSVCLCVCLSHVSKRLNISSNFLPSGSHTILVFSYQIVWQYSDRNPSNGDVEWRVGMKNSDFRSIYLFISEMIQDRDTITMERQ